MLPSIPASDIVNIMPAALAAGGSSMSLNTVAISASSKFPIKEYFSADSVAADFGTQSPEFAFATNYFLGFTGSQIKPNSLFIALYATQDTTASLVGRSLRTMSLEELQAVNGDITVTIDGSVKTGTVDLTSATSFSDAAAQIATSLTIDVVFDAQLQAFILMSPTTGSASQISYATGAAADTLGLSQAQGATLNQVTEKDDAASLMQRVTSSTLNFAPISYIKNVAFDLDFKKDLAKWVGAQAHRYWFISYDKEPTALIAGSVANFAAWIKENGIQDTTPIYGEQKHAAFLCGSIASLDFTMPNGRRTMDFRNQSGIDASVTNLADAKALTANGYAFYGAWATANDRFQFLRNAVVSGEFAWADTYAFQIWLNSQFQLDGMLGLQQYGTIPYNEIGKGYFRAMFQDTINQGIAFGGIVAGVTLTEQQRAVINSEFGYDAASQIELQGWAMFVGDATGEIRQKRGSFPAKFYYADGGSVQSINMTSTAVL